MKYKFGITKVDKHEHVYESIKVVDIEADNPNYSIAKNGVWSFITRYCSCGKEEAVDFLQRNHAEDKLEALIERG